jgi:hypothetical protein
MRRNAVKALMTSGGTALIGWAGIGNSYSAELLGHAGFDGVVVDMHAQAVDLAPEESAAADEPAADDATETPAGDTTDEGYSLNGERVEKLPGDDDTKN